MIGKTCDVRMYKGPCDCKVACERCRVGCNNPARHKNPFFGKDFSGEDRGDGPDRWWRGGYSYAEYLCAECYDHLVSEAREFEEMYREHGGAEDPEYTKILETL